MKWSCSPMKISLFSCSSGEMTSMTSCVLVAHLRIDIPMSSRVVVISLNRPMTCFVCHRNQEGHEHEMS